MTKNEVSTPVVPQEPTAVPQTPVVPETPVTEAPVAPVQPIEPAQPVAPMQPVETVVQQPTPQPAMPVEGSNGFANLIAKLKAFGVGPIVTVAVVAVVLVGGIILSVASSTPKAVFKNAINKVYKGANVAIKGYETYLDEYDLTKNALLVNGTFTLESNIEEYEEYNLNKMTIGFDAGVDYKNQVLSMGGSLKGNKETVKVNAQLQNNEMYITSSLFKEVLKLDSDMISELGLEYDFESFKEEIERIQKEYDTDPETYEYIVKTLKKALVKSIDSEFMEKEKDEIDILDKEVKVTKYSYIFDEDAIQDLLTKLSEQLLEDDEFIKSISAAMGVEKKEVKELLKELKKSAKDIEFDGEAALNIYTKGLFNSYAGIGLELEGKEYFSLYTDGKNVEMTIDDHVSGDYGTKIVMTMEKDGKGYKGVLKENKEKLLEVNFKELTDEVIDSEFILYEDGEKLGTIKFYLKVKMNKDSFVSDYEFRITEAESKEYIGFKGNYNLSIKDKVEKTNGKNAIAVEDLDVDKVKENIEKIAENDEALGTLIEDAVASLEEEMLDLNYNGMLEIESTELEKVLSKNKATVLYIGKSSYSYYYDEAAYDMLDNLTDLQTELGFYSYYLSEYDMNSTTEELLKDVQYVCPTETSDINTDVPIVEGQGDSNATTNTPVTQTCTGYPAIYLIKDGKVQKAFRQTVSYDDLSAALAEIGIE